MVFFDTFLAPLEKTPAAIGKKDWLFRTYREYMYTRLLAMFEYKNLPETLPHEFIELYLLSNGNTFVTKVKGELYCFVGNWGGEPDPYYRPSKYIVANPALELSETYDWKTDGVLMRNNFLYAPLENLVTRYAAFMAENALTLRTADVLLRMIALLSAQDDKTLESAKEYLKNLLNGEVGVIAEGAFFDGIKMQTTQGTAGGYITQFIELHQYFKGSFFNEIGLNANFNMKREAIGVGEAALSQDSLLPLCDSMLHCRMEDCQKINAMYGTNIEVAFASAWKNNQLESKLELEKLKAESSSQLGKGADFNEESDEGDEEIPLDTYETREQDYAADANNDGGDDSSGNSDNDSDVSSSQLEKGGESSAEEEKRDGEGESNSEMGNTNESGESSESSDENRDESGESSENTINEELSGDGIQVDVTVILSESLEGENEKESSQLEEEGDSDDDEKEKEED